MISAVSFDDTMVDRIVFGWLAKSVLDNIGRTKVCVGWVPLFGAWRHFRENFGDKILAVDKTAWDWTVQAWMIEALRQLVLRLAVNAPPWLVRLINKRFNLLFKDCVYQFQDGSQIKQGEVGIMKSGCFLTIILNSFSQLLLHVVAIERMGVLDPGLPYSLGDDTVQEVGDLDVERYVSELKALGSIPKPEILDHVEFAGFSITRTSCIPVYRAKHLFKLEYTSNLVDYLRDMQMLYANCDEGYAFFSTIALKLARDGYLPRPTALKLLNAQRGDLRLGS